MMKVIFESGGGGVFDHKIQIWGNGAGFVQVVCENKVFESHLVCTKHLLRDDVLQLIQALTDNLGETL